MWITPDRMFYVGPIGAPSVRTMAAVIVYVAQGCVRISIAPTPRGVGIRSGIRRVFVESASTARLTAEQAEMLVAWCD